MQGNRASTVPVAANAERIAMLSELCNDAAKHVAQARVALFGARADTDGALDHLDQAILCLRRFAAQGRNLGPDGPKETPNSA